MLGKIQERHVSPWRVARGHAGSARAHPIGHGRSPHQHTVGCSNILRAKRTKPGLGQSFRNGFRGFGFWRHVRAHALKTGNHASLQLRHPQTSRGCRSGTFSAHGAVQWRHLAAVGWSHCYHGCHMRRTKGWKSWKLKAERLEVCAILLCACPGRSARVQEDRQFQTRIKFARGRDSYARTPLPRRQRRWGPDPRRTGAGTWPTTQTRKGRTGPRAPR